MLGEEIRKARKAVGLTQEQLAFAAGLHPTYISMLENNRTSPTLDVIFRLCVPLKVRPHRLILRVERALAEAGRPYQGRRRR
jgi:transcriptional regulator with XRE-family HTH domain